MCPDSLNGEINNGRLARVDGTQARPGSNAGPRSLIYLPAGCSLWAPLPLWTAGLSCNQALSKSCNLSAWTSGTRVVSVQFHKSWTTVEQTAVHLQISPRAMRLEAVRGWLCSPPALLIPPSWKTKTCIHRKAAGSRRLSLLAHLARSSLPASHPGSHLSSQVGIEASN